MVRFACRNGLDEGYRSAMTYIMYLAPEPAKTVVQNLCRTLADGG